MARQNPNIVITGTPGVGKTTHAEQLAQATGFKHVSVNQIVKDEGFHEGKDEETGSWIVDEDKVRILSRHFTPTTSIICASLTQSSPTAPRLPRIPPLSQHRRLHPRLARVRPLPRTLDRPRHCAALRLDASLRPPHSPGLQGEEVGGEYG